MKIIIFDFEVLKYDTLLGCKIINNDGSLDIFQTWDVEEIKKFYNDNLTSMWVGHNCIGYDNIIMETILKRGNPYKKSKEIVKEGNRAKAHLPIQTYDLMNGFYSLKTTEYIVGKNISESEVDFDLDRPLTDEEKKLTESYNRDDLEQTYDNFLATMNTFSLRLEIMKEFGLPPSCLTVTGTKLASIVLGAKAIPGIERDVVKPKIYDTLRLKNEALRNYYLENKFRTSEKLKITLCGCEHQIGSGGIHAALNKYHTDRALYFDVSGYYNLVMINYNLLPRTMPPESRDKYIYMYHEQLRLKKIDPVKRSVYKTILLSVFGAMMNEYTDFYDPWNGLLVTITGQLFLVDLLEKLEGKVKVIQSNTDGIMLEPFNWDKKDEIIKIVEEWETRTGFVIKKEEIHNLWQRDVNNYTYEKDGHIEVKGEALKPYGAMDNLIASQAWTFKESPIISFGIVNYLQFGKSPEQTVEEYKTNLLMFQFACKKLSFDYLELEEIDKDTGNIKTTRLQNVNRVFPAKKELERGIVYKHKERDGKHTKSKIAGLPENMFVYNGDIRGEETVKELDKRIDFDYYVNRIYERILEFVNIPKVKDFDI